MRILFFVGWLFCAAMLTAQTNPSIISEKVLKDSPFSVSLPTIEGTLLNHENLSDAVNNPDRNTFDVNFRTDQIGFFTNVVKYLENGRYFYTTIEIEVVESIVETFHDYDEVIQGEVAIIDVQNNDVSTAGGLEVVALPYVTNGSAQIINGFVEFIPESAFSGLAYLTYVVRDVVGNSETGFATINVITEKSSLGEEYFLQIGESLDIVVPSETTVGDFFKSYLGKFSQSNQGSITYHAGKKVGKESVAYKSNGGLSEIVIHVLGKEEDHLFVRDDVVFTNSGSTVKFDVFANDLEKNFPIVSKSPELKNISPKSGQFSYTAPDEFQGVENFFYQVSDGENTFIGNIEVIIDNFLPEVRDYDFTTRVNTPFVLEYPLPTDNGVINFVQAPVHGTLRLDPNGFRYECGSVLGEDFLVYTPNDGYTGLDEFAIEYCSAGGDCVGLEIVMDVVSASDDCNCVGPECAWPGDADGDGRVSVKDLLPIGYYMGGQGPLRAEPGDSWNALHAQDWNENLPESGKNIKSVDSNGDGIIDINDVDALNANYAKLNSFVTREALSIKNVPFYAVPRQRSGANGDLVLIDLYVGTEAQPLLESNGLAFNFNIPPSYIEENSLQFSFAPEAWYGYNNPTIDFIQYPTQGRVEASMSRTGRSTVDGFGVIGTFQIVLQEDTDGIKPDSDRLPINIEITGGEYVSEDGSSNGLENSELTIYLELDNQNVEQEIDVIAYPNPTNNLISFHANNQDEIQSIEVTNLLGQRVLTQPNIQSNHFEMNTRELAQGFYMARVETNLGVSLERIQIIRD